MNELEQKQAFYVFLEEYASFFDGMIVAQNEKLEALLSHSVEPIEHAVSKQQALSMLLDQYEEKRVELQKNAGFCDWPMSRILSALSGEDTEHVRVCFERISDGVEQVKYLNNKAMELVNTNLQLIDNAAPLETRSGAQGYDQKGKKESGWGKGASLLETKI